MDEALQTPGGSSPLKQVQREAEFIALDVITSAVGNEDKEPTNKYCKTMRRKVKEFLDRHDIIIKGKVSKINLDESSPITIFAQIADETFDDGQITWVRTVAVYAFAVGLARQYYKKSSTYPAEIAHHAGIYVANKFGLWIFDHGGWDAFAEYFPDPGWTAEDVLKGLLLIGMGVGALALIAALR